MNRSRKILFGSIAVVVLLVGAIAGYVLWNKVSTERFLADFNAINAPYKQALFQTGQGNRGEATANFNAFVTALADFQLKYASPPHVIKDKAAFTESLTQVSNITNKAREDVITGNLSHAHTTLEGIRPIFADMLRTNNLSLLSVALVDFHDSMETVLTASDNHDAALVLTLYQDADAKLKIVEAEQNDTGVQAIRARLESLKTAAENGKTDDLSSLAAQLKTSYVKVYLAEG